ncbi:MAG: tRNA (adenosine(37)-N6)-dimethylallyltransferase MiaA [Gammaproteobacteria bacterium]|nr:tRNA (adenosine(37)-N6)-dimethylallyltransferase MiaA [Gammaproteobacteria bacterium]
MPESTLDNRPPAVFLMGPTASGKTDFALAMAERHPFEVISVDSALVYRGMNIGTAKPDAQFLARLPHQLIDIRDPDQSYSVAEFRRDALQCMREITGRGNIPLLVGGTMLYFKALYEGLAELPATQAEVRQRVLDEAAQVGWPALHAQLATIDPATAAQLHPNHSQRIQRALEVYYASGETLSALQARQPRLEFPYRTVQLALWPDDRAALHQRIAQRFADMLEQGFINELVALRAQYTLSPDLPSMRAVGYRQVWEYLEGLIDREQLLASGVAATRQLAKRQFTWLRKWPDLHTLIVNFDANAPNGTMPASNLSKIDRLLGELDH